MKKIILFIFGLLVFIPNMIFADMGAPGVEPYKATITNKNGAILYNREYDKEKNEHVYKDTKKKLEYGKTITITFEEYGYAIYDEYYINVADLTAVVKSYTMKDKEWGKKETAIVLKKTVLRQGPAGGYASTGVTLEPGTKVTARVNKNTAMYPWAYIEYNGNKGYMETLGATLAYGESTGTIMAFTNAKIIDSETGLQKGTLKANSVIKGTYYQLDAWSRSYYFDRDEIKGIVSIYEIATIEEEALTGTLKRDIKLYDLVDMDNENNMKEVATLKKGTKITANMYAHFNWGIVYYYQDGNTKGWVYDIDVQPEDDENYDSSDPKYGFALDYSFEKVANAQIDLEENIMTDLNNTTTNSENNTSDVTTPEDSTSIVKEEGSRTIPYEKLFMGVVVALILCIAALVTVILINRKKNRIDD